MQLEKTSIILHYPSIYRMDVRCFNLRLISWYRSVQYNHYNFKTKINIGQPIIIIEQFLGGSWMIICNELPPNKTCPAPVCSRPSLFHVCCRPSLMVLQTCPASNVLQTCFNRGVNRLHIQTLCQTMWPVNDRWWMYVYKVSYFKVRTSKEHLPHKLKRVNVFNVENVTAANPISTTSFKHLEPPFTKREAVQVLQS